MAIVKGISPFLSSLTSRDFSLLDSLHPGYLYDQVPQWEKVREDNTMFATPEMTDAVSYAQLWVNMLREQDKNMSSFIRPLLGNRKDGFCIGLQIGHSHGCVNKRLSEARGCKRHPVLRKWNCSELNGTVWYGSYSCNLIAQVTLCYTTQVKGRGFLGSGGV